MEPYQIPAEERTLGFLGFVIELIRGILVVAGLTLLWVLEAVRDRFFRMLDRLKVPAPKRVRASAFPPGRPRKR